MMMCEVKSVSFYPSQLGDMKLSETLSNQYMAVSVRDRKLHDVLGSSST